MLSVNFKIIIPVVLSLLILLGLIVAVLIIRKRSNWNHFDLAKVLRLLFVTESSSQGRILAPSQSETPSIANIMSKGNSEPNYPGVRVQNNNLSFSSVDSNKYKAEGNGMQYFIFVFPHSIALQSHSRIQNTSKTCALMQRSSWTSKHTAKAHTAETFTVDHITQCADRSFTMKIKTTATEWVL